MQPLAALFSTILAALRAAIAPVAARDRTRTALLVHVWSRLSRMATRFERLFARWQAGTLPKPRPSRAGQPRSRANTPRLPSGRAWLVVTVRETASIALQINLVLSHPDLPAFLHAAPQAGRILRPLCHMLGLPPPTQNPQHPRPPRHPHPPAAPPPPLPAHTPLCAAPRFSPA